MPNDKPIRLRPVGSPEERPDVIAPPSSTSELEARERLLEAALNAFATHGYEAASLRAIADAAGVAYQLIGYHFGAKDELWKAAADLSYRRYLESGRSLGFDLSGDLREQFHNHLRALLIGTVRTPQWLKIVTHEYLAGSERYHDFIRPRVEELTRLIAMPYHEQLARLGVITRFSAQEANLILLAFIVMVLLCPHNIAATIGIPSGELQSIDFQVDLLYSICIRGAGQQRPAHDDAVDATGLRPGQELQVTQSGHRWGEQYEGLPASQLARLRELETENESLKQLVGELSLEKRQLQQALKTR